MTKKIDFNKAKEKAGEIAKGEWERMNRHPLKYLGASAVKAAFLVKAGVPLAIVGTGLAISSTPAANRARKWIKEKRSSSEAVARKQKRDNKPKA